MNVAVISVSAAIEMVQVVTIAQELAAAAAPPQVLKRELLSAPLAVSRTAVLEVLNPTVVSKVSADFAGLVIAIEP